MEKGKIIVMKKVGINPEKENLTAEKLKTFNGLEKISDADANETVFALQTLANILYDLMGDLNTNQQKQAA